MSDYMAQLLNAKEASMNIPSPPVGLQTEAPTLDEQIAWLQRRMDWGHLYNVQESPTVSAFFGAAILASLEELQRLKSTPVAAIREGEGK